MALFSFHCQNYKAGALVGIDGHNRRLHKNHKSNLNIVVLPAPDLPTKATQILIMNALPTI